MKLEIKEQIPVCRGRHRRRLLHHVGLPRQTPPTEKTHDDKSAVSGNALQRRVPELTAEAVSDLWELHSLDSLGVLVVLLLRFPLKCFCRRGRGGKWWRSESVKRQKWEVTKVCKYNWKKCFTTAHRFFLLCYVGRVTVSNLYDQSECLLQKVLLE